LRYQIEISIQTTQIHGSLARILLATNEGLQDSGEISAEILGERVGDKMEASGTISNESYRKNSVNLTIQRESR
jgi:hypothetical protein